MDHGSNVTTPLIFSCVSSFLSAHAVTDQIETRDLVACGSLATWEIPDFFGSRLAQALMSKIDVKIRAPDWSNQYPGLRRQVLVEQVPMK